MEYRKRWSGVQKRRRGVQEKEDWSTGKGGLEYRKRRSGVHEKEEGRTGNGGLEYRKRRSEVEEKEEWITGKKKWSTGKGGKK